MKAVSDGCSATAQTLFTLPGSAWLRGNMAERELQMPVISLASTYYFTAFWLSIFVAFATFRSANTDNVFSASHTATVPIAAARDLR